MKTDYLELVRMIIEDQLPFETFLRLCGVDKEAAEEELQELLPVEQTLTSDPKPIYVFKGHEYPNLTALFHWTKMFTFAHGGSPYKDGSLSEYDFRKENPYVQAGVYDEQKGAFITGLRFLPLHKVSFFEESAMHSLYTPTASFLKHYIQSVEIGQTFVVPDAIGGNHLFSILSAIIAGHPDAQYLCGKPTIEGRIPDVSKEIISAFAYDAFRPDVNPLFGPSMADNLFDIVDGIVVPPLRSLAEIVRQYNIDFGGSSILEYDPMMSIQKKRKLTEKLLIDYGGALPPMFKFYAVLTEEQGMIMLASSVINPVYTTKAWEFPILLDKTKIIPKYKSLVDHYTEIFKGKQLIY